MPQDKDAQPQAAAKAEPSPQKESPSIHAKVQCISDRMPWARVLNEQGENGEQGRLRPLVIEEVVTVSRRDADELKRKRFAVEIA